MSIRPLPRPVSWTERDGKTKVKAKVIKEVSVDDSYKHGDFHRVLQVVRIDGENEDTIRIGYYVKDRKSSAKNWRWGSQTTFMTSKKSFMKLIAKAKQKGLI